MGFTISLLSVTADHGSIHAQLSLFTQHKILIIQFYPPIYPHKGVSQDSIYCKGFSSWSQCLTSKIPWLRALKFCQALCVKLTEVEVPWRGVWMLKQYTLKHWFSKAVICVLFSIHLPAFITILRACAFCGK